MIENRENAIEEFIKLVNESHDDPGAKAYYDIFIKIFRKDIIDLKKVIDLE